MPDLTDDIETVAAEPASSTSDGQSATSHPLPDLIEADKYLKGAAALDGTASGGGPRSAWRGVRMARGIPPGAT